MKTSKRALHRRRALSFHGLLLLSGFASPAHADSERMMPAHVPPIYVQECASCHLAFPPGLLPKVSWQRLMSQLGRHYGSDASLDANATREIENWLVAHGGTGKRVREAPLEERITRSAWFERKHRKISTATWQLASVKSAANCAACHADAEQGDFDDDRLRIPAGLPAHQQSAWRD